MLCSLKHGLGSTMLMASPCTSIPAICLCCPSPLRSRLTILPPLDSLPTCLPRGFHSTGHQSKLSQTSSCSNALYFGSGPPDPGLFRPRPWTSPWMRPVSAPPSDLVPSILEAAFSHFVKGNFLLLLNWSLRQLPISDAISSPLLLDLWA